jgi:hypothetical protein
VPPHSRCSISGFSIFAARARSIRGRNRQPATGLLPTEVPSIDHPSMNYRFC